MKTRKQGRRLLNGIKLLKSAQKALIMTLILLPQLTLSQTATTNLQNETVTLDKEKAIDVAKIIKNEERLREVNGELLEIIRKQDSTIQSITERNIKGLESIHSQNQIIGSLTSNIDKLAKSQLELEESKNQTGRLFLSLSYEFNNPYMRSGSVGLDYFGTGRFSIGANLNPLNEQLIWGAKIGIKIF